MKNKKVIGIIIAVLVVLIGIGGSLVLFLNSNNNNIDDVKSDPLESTSISIDQKYTDKKIVDGDSAIASLNDVADFLGITDPKNEFELKSETTSGEITYYRLNQKYKNIPVYGTGLVITVDKNNDATGLSSSYISMENVDVEPKIKKDKVVKLISSYVKKEYKELKKEFEISNDINLIFFANQKKEIELAWHCNVKFGFLNSITVYASAINGEILYVQENMLNYKNTSSSSLGEAVIQADGGLIDRNRNIECFYITMDDEDRAEEYYNHDVTINIKNFKNENEKNIAINTFTNAQLSIDFYSLLGRNSFNNMGGKNWVFIAQDDCFTEPKGGSTVNYSSIIIPKPNIDFPKSPGYALDIIAHEYTHGVIMNEINFNKNLHGSALHEGYADIIGNCVEQYYKDIFDDEWQLGEDCGNVKYKMSEPFNYNMIDKNDDGHYNARLISHTAYLMWNGGIKETEKLAQIWYNSLLLKDNPNATFLDCRNAVIKSAKQLYKEKEITYEQLAVVIEAFETVGIKDNTLSHYFNTVNNNFTLNVYDIVDKKHNNYHLKIEDTQRGNLSKGVVFDEEIKSTDKFISLKDKDGNLIKNGAFIFTITNLDNPKQKQSIKIVVKNEKSLTTDNVDIPTYFYSKNDSNNELSNLLLNNKWINLHLPNYPYIFKNDGNYILIGDNGEESKGKYILNGNILTLTYNDGFNNVSEKWEYNKNFSDEKLKKLKEKLNIDINKCFYLINYKNGDSVDWNEIIEYDNIAWKIMVINEENDYTAIQHFNGHTYAIFDKSLTWQEAKEYCESLGGHLVTITSKEEQDFVVSLLQKGDKWQYWLGGNDVDSKENWQWVTNEPWSYTNWNPGQPDNIGHCLQMFNSKGNLAYTSNGYWFDNDGKNTETVAGHGGTLNNVGFICEWDYTISVDFFNGHTYAIFDKSLTWQEAKEYCESLGGHLVTITSKEEQNFIENLLDNGSKWFYWLGGTDEKVEGDWKWVTSETWTYDNWKNISPSNFQGIEHYLAIINTKVTWWGSVYNKGDWNDFSPEGTNEELNSFGFICEWDYINENVNITNTDYIYMEELTPINSDRYTGNQGDSVIMSLKESSWTNVDIQGNTWEHGLLGWVARWNSGWEVSWVWNEYDIGQKYELLSGKIVLLPHRYTKDFDTKFEIIGDDKVLFSMDLTPENIPTAEINVDISNVKIIKISFYDNKSAAGGCPFGLVDFRLKYKY